VTDATRVQLFFSLGLVVAVLLPLLVGAFFVEVLAPRSRTWLKRLRRMEQGRAAQGARQ